MIDWRLAEHRDTVYHFVHDPDPDCRRRAMRRLNPGGEAMADLRALRTYARIAAEPGELPRLRLHAYRALLMATGFRVHDHFLQESEAFIESGGSFEQAPRIDRSLIQFFLSESSDDCSYSTALTFTTGAGCRAWRDLHGRAFYSVEELLPDILLPAHEFVATRLPHYRMTISFTPCAPAADSAHLHGGNRR